MGNNAQMTAEAARLQPSLEQLRTDRELRPVLRWAGGKRQLLERLHSVFPEDFDLSRNSFYEPFIGGGALTFSLSGGKFGSPVQEPLRRNQIYIGDQNELLVNLYRSIRDNVEELIRILNSKDYLPTEEMFYKIRNSKKRCHKTENAARFIFLNRLCFNGLYRVNSNGEFNVPFGRLKNPTVCDEPLLRTMSEFLHHVDINHGSFDETTSSASEGDLVYFDPPYIPLSPTSSFTRYDVNDFRDEDHCELMDCILQLKERGVRVILSNSFTERTIEIYGAGELELYSVSVNRSISASSKSRQRTTEVIGVSFPIKESKGLTKINP